MFFFGKRRKEQTEAEKERADALWSVVQGKVPLLHGLTPAEQHTLQQLVVQFLDEKKVDPTAGLQLSPKRRWIIASQACLPILHLGLDYYDNWRSLIVHPDTFLPGDGEMDEIGLMHGPTPHSGLSMPNGPVVISWGDVARELREEGEYPINTIIHELIHQMDVRTGGFDGLLPLHPEQDRHRWLHDFTRARSTLRRALRQGRDWPIDPYAEEDPAEFLAVMGETFFVAPQILHHYFPEIYDHLKSFFHQDPLHRQG